MTHDTIRVTRDRGRLFFGSSGDQSRTARAAGPGSRLQLPPPPPPQLPVAPGAPGLVAAPLPPLLLLCVCLSSSVPYEDTVLAQRPPAPRGPHLTVLAPVRSARPLFQIKPCSQLLTSDVPGAPRSPPQAPPPRGFLPQKPAPLRSQSPTSPGTGPPESSLLENEDLEVPRLWVCEV